MAGINPYLWPAASSLRTPDLGKQVCQEPTGAWQVTSPSSEEEEGSARLSVWLQPVGGKHYIPHRDGPLPPLHSERHSEAGAGVQCATLKGSRLLLATTNTIKARASQNW